MTGTHRIWRLAALSAVWALTVITAPLHAAATCAPHAVAPGVLKEPGLPASGHVTQAWACKDAVGEHLIQAIHQASTDPLWGTQLLFTKHTRTPSGWKKDWQARDFVLTPPSTPIAEILLIKDADGDSLADVFIAYTLPGQDKANDEGKLLVFYKDKKYAIRGAIARSPDDFGSRKISPDFLTLPQAVQTQALQLWDKLSAPGSGPSATTPVFNTLGR